MRRSLVRAFASVVVALASPAIASAATLPLPGPPVLVYSVHTVNGLIAEPTVADGAKLNANAAYFGAAAASPNFAPPASALVSGGTPSTFDGATLDLSAAGN